MTEHNPEPGLNNHNKDPVPREGLPAGIIILPLAEPDVEEAARLYVEVFLADEPTSHRIAPDPATLLPSAEWYVRSLADRNFSFIARDERSGDLVGFIFCYDLSDDFGQEKARFTALFASFREAIVMIDELENRYPDLSGVSPGSVLHAFQGGVGRKYRRAGVFAALVRQAVSCARDRGFWKIIGDCTSSASQEILEQCGFRVEGFLGYDTFTIDGVRFFDGLPGGITLMVKDL